MHSVPSLGWSGIEHIIGGGGGGHHVSRILTSLQQTVGTLAGQDHTSGRPAAMAMHDKTSNPMSTPNGIKTTLHIQCVVKDYMHSMIKAYKLDWHNAMLLLVVLTNRLPVFLELNLLLHIVVLLWLQSLAPQTDPHKARCLLVTEQITSPQCLSLRTSSSLPWCIQESAAWPSDLASVTVLVWSHCCAASGHYWIHCMDCCWQSAFFLLPWLLVLLVDPSQDVLNLQETSGSNHHKTHPVKYCQLPVCIFHLSFNFPGKCSTGEEAVNTPPSSLNLGGGGIVCFLARLNLPLVCSACRRCSPWVTVWHCFSAWCQHPCAWGAWSNGGASPGCTVACAAALPRCADTYSHQTSACSACHAASHPERGQTRKVKRSRSRFSTAYIMGVLPLLPSCLKK